MPEEALVVRKIFELYAAGKGFRAISNQLNREGHKTKKGNTFGTDSIREIITNPVYVGIVRYNRFEGWNEKRRRGKNPNPILTEGKHEAIISQGIWEKVQALFKQKSKENPRLYDSKNLLTGLIRCPQCGTPMVASRTTNHLQDGTKVVRRYYSCGQFRSKGSSVCSANSVQADYAEQYVMGRIKEVINQPQMLRNIVTAVNRKRIESVDPLKQELVAIENKRQQLTSKKKKIMDVYEMDNMDKETLIARMDELTAAEDALHARKSEIMCELREDFTNEFSFNDVHKLLASLDEILEKSLPEQKKTLLRLAVKRIEISGIKKIEKIELNISDAITDMKSAPSANMAVGADSFCVPRRITLVI